MLRRVLAWILLIGFIALIVNIVFIGYRRTESLTVYLFIAVFFLFTLKNKKDWQ